MSIHILHLHSTFNLGGKEARAVRLMNAFGDRARHTIVSSEPDAYGAQAAIDPSVRYEIAQNPPPLTGRLSVRRFEAIANYLSRFDLVLTYNWGAIDGVMAARIFGKNVPPIVHHEDGFNADETVRLSHVRNMYRRIALPAANALVVPSEKLEAIARDQWRQPAGRVHRISNGVATSLFAAKPNADLIPELRKRKPGTIVIGAVAGLRPVKDLPMLVRACAGLNSRFKLVIVGEGSERDAIIDAAESMAVEDDVILTGFLPNPQTYMGLFDIFALSSESEQAPVSVIEAMAAGLPVVSPDVGDIMKMVGPTNQKYIAPERSEVALRDRLEILAKHPELREFIGKENKQRARELYDDTEMVSAYARLYSEALGSPGLLG